MSNILDKLKAEHPEWCFRCGHVKGSYIHDELCAGWTVPAPVIAALVAALEEAEENDQSIQASLLKEGYEVGDGESAYNALFDLIVDFEHAEAERDSLRAQLTTSEAARTAAEGALAVLLDNFEGMSPTPILESWIEIARAALKGTPDEG